MTLPGDFSATLVDEWVRAGVRDAVIAPGSRSSPLAIALVSDRRLRTHVRLDERSAGFFAIGLSLSTGRPVVVLTTSGTAASELHPAVVEADLASVPLIVCTADRPFELHGVGAPQTIDQTHLFGRSPRYFFDFGVPNETAAPQWRALASRLVAEAMFGVHGPGPVHANLAFREPFDGKSGQSSSGRSDGRSWHEVVAGDVVSKEALDRLVEVVSSAPRGLVVAGRGAGDPAAVEAFGRAVGYPILADSLAFPRRPMAGLVAAWDPIVKGGSANDVLRPDLVVHLGAPPASRALSTWLARIVAEGARHVLVDPYRRFADPARLADVVLVASPSELLAGAAARFKEAVEAEAAFSTSWAAAEDAAQWAIDETLTGDPNASEPAAARDLAAALPDSSTVVVSSSMPVRDYDAFARPRPGAPLVFSNRGANGIDGVSSTVLGVASGFKGSGASGPTVGLLGDLAFLHDLSALVRGREEDSPDAAFVVVDNGGGGIFSFLPYAGELDAAMFERAFATPQSVDIAEVARSLDCGVEEVNERSELAPALEQATASHGVNVVVVRTDRAQNVVRHAAIDAAVDVAVEKALSSS